MTEPIRARYDRDGYVVLERLFGAADVAGWKAGIRGVLDEAGTPANGVFVGLAVRSPLLKAAAADLRLVGPLTEAIGPTVEFLSDKIVFKSTGVDFGTPWHQDWSYWHGIHKVSVWIALDDATPANGCLKVIPGSHRVVARHDGAADDGTGFDNRLDPRAVDESRAVALPAPAGTAVMFHDLLLHASFPNATGEDRWALISTYRDAAVSDPDCDDIAVWRHAFLVAGNR